MARRTNYTDQVDKAVGNQVFELRIAMGWSRQQLSDKIGVSHQQMQKYEKSVNRISAGRLAAIARAFRKNISYFFETIEESEYEAETQHQRMCIEVSRNFMQIEDPKHQDAVNLLVKNLSN